MTLNPKVSLVAGILCISFYPIFVRLAHADAVTSAFYRMLFALIFMLPYCVIKGYLKISKKGLNMAFLAGAVFAADIAIWNIAILEISATISTLIANLAPVWVGLISFLFLRKRSGTMFWVGVMVAIIGMVVLVGYKNILLLDISLGVWLSILSSFLYSIYIILTKGILQKVNTITFMMYGMVSSTVCLFAATWVRGAEMIHFPVPTWIYFVLSGLICQLLGWLTINYAIKHLQPSKVSITLLSQTVATGILAALILKEKLGAVEIIGSIIVLTGIAITFIKPKRVNKSVI